MTEHHACTRARERYGLELREHELIQIARDARKDGIVIAKEHDGSVIYMVKVRGIVCRVVLSPGGRVMTFLPRRYRLNRKRMENAG